MSKLIGPVEVELKVHVTDGKRDGEATYNLPVGGLPTEESIVRACGVVLRQLGGEFRLMNDSEFLNRVVVKDATGRVGNFAVPSAYAYDVDDLTARATEAALAVEAEQPDEADEDESWDDDEDDDEEFQA